MKQLCAACLTILSLSTLATAQSERVAVFVTSAGAVNGLSDPSKDNQDTVKDLRNAIKDRNSLTLSETRESADIVLVVMNREKAQITAGMFGGASRDVMVRVKFIYKDAESEMSASAQGGTLSAGGAWSRAAGKVSKQVEDWVKANRAALAK